MDNIEWLKQTDKPLFPDVLWSRPENKRTAGKLLVVGGHAQQFNEPSQAYTASLKAGIGTTRVLLPNSLQKTLGKAFPEAEFGASTPVGSFSRQALGLCLELADWADGALLAGDFGRNSETAILLENFLAKAAGQVTVAGDSLDYFLNEPERLLDRKGTTLVINFPKLQKILSGRLLLKHSMALAQVIEALSRFAASCPSALITAHSGQIIVVYKDRISTTKSNQYIGAGLAAYASVWQLQQPKKAFEALSTAVFCL